MVGTAAVASKRPMGCLHVRSGTTHGLASTAFSKAARASRQESFRPAELLRAARALRARCVPANRQALDPGRFIWRYVTTRRPVRARMLLRFCSAFSKFRPVLCCQRLSASLLLVSLSFRAMMCYATLVNAVSVTLDWCTGL